MTEQELFYHTCAEILGIPHEYTAPVKRRNRWNTRRLGNGRFPGFGLVQYFGPTAARVVSKNGTKFFQNTDAVYAYLRTLCEK